MKVLIISNDGKLRAMVAAGLQGIGGVSPHILEASSRAEALDRMNAPGDLDCAFLDQRLGGWGSLQLLRQIHDPKTGLGPCPIVVIIERGMEAKALKALGYGAQDYLLKEYVTADTLKIAMTKARQGFKLKLEHCESERLLERSQKMEAVGNLAGGVAHDFNNLLTIIFGNTRLLKDMVQGAEPDTEACLKKIQLIDSTAKRGAELVKRLMIFSRQRTLQPVTIEIPRFIRDLEELLSRSLGDMVKMDIQCAPDAWLVDADPGQLEHALINIAVNARDAMPYGGTLTLAVRNASVGRRQASELDVPAGDYLCLSLTDTGVGISEDVLDKIFDPFFTTKDIGKGTGLGLSIVYGIIRQSGGAVSVSSRKGEGTTFCLYLPKSADKAVRMASYAQRPLAERGGSETILVVEDEEEIRSLTRDMLRSKGYRVLEAANGEDALYVLQNSQSAVHLLFTDIAMPGELNGVQMAGRAQVLKPDIKLLFTTGYASDNAPDIELIRKYPVLEKPYQPATLLTKVREVLDRRA